MHDAFYEAQGDAYIATPMTRGPWDERFQHGGPPAALLARAVQRLDGDYHLARIAVDLLRPIPIGNMRVELGPISGRSVQRVEVSLLADDQLVMVARATRIRNRSIDVPTPASPAPWPEPDSLDDYQFTFFRHELGYHKGVQLRIAHGEWGTTPIGVWARPRIDLVAGEPTSPVEGIMILADAQSGMGVPLSPLEYTFLNPDLTVYFERPPAAGWFGFDIRSAASTTGMGLAQSAIRDAQGLVARSAQSLLVDKR